MRQKRETRLAKNNIIADLFCTAPLEEDSNEDDANRMMLTRANEIYCNDKFIFQPNCVEQQQTLIETPKMDPNVERKNQAAVAGRTAIRYMLKKHRTA